MKTQLRSTKLLITDFKKLDNYKVHTSQPYWDVVKKILDGEEGYEIHMDNLPPVAIKVGDTQNLKQEAKCDNFNPSPYNQNKKEDTI